MTAVTLSNGVKLLYIQDELSTETYSSLSFQVGSFNNPPEVKGLAHFLEHLLFISSIKQPEVDYFGKQTEKLSGHYNAYTSTEFTNFVSAVYSNDIQQLDLLQDILVHMFVEPVISQEQIEKEVSAVDSEQEQHMHDDNTKMMDIVEEFMQPQHPLSLFNCGNKQSLYSHFADKNFLQDIILLFRFQHQNANNATMVVSGPMKTSVMVDLLSKKLEMLQNYDFHTHQDEFVKKYPHINIDSQFKSRESLATWDGVLPWTKELHAVEMQSVGPANIVQLTFQIIIPDHKEDMSFLSFVKHLFQQSEAGSLEHYLKEKLKVISFGFSDYNSFMSDNIGVASFKLDEAGIKDNHRIKSVIAAQQEQLDFLLSSDEALLKRKQEQFRDLSLLRFNQSEPERDMMRNSHIANNILKQGFEDAFMAKEEYPPQNHALFSSILMQIRDSQVSIIFKPANNKDTTVFEHTSTYQKGNYNILSLDDNAGKYWSVIDFLKHAKAIKTDNQKFYIQENQIHDLSIDQHFYKSNEYVLHPEELKTMQVSPNTKVQMLRDGQQHLPVSIIDIFVNTNLNTASYRNQALSHLVFNLMSEKFGMEQQNFYELGQSVHLESKVSGYRIQIKGFTKWILLVFNTVMDMFKDEKIFTDNARSIKEIDSWINALENFKNNKPQLKLKVIIQQLLVKNKIWNNRKLIEELKSIKDQIKKKKEILAFRNELLKKIGFSNILLVGDVNSALAQQIVDTYKTMFATSDSQYEHKQQTVMLPDKLDQTIDIPNENADEGQNSLSWFQQVRFKTKQQDQVLSQLLAKYASSHIFTSLRTNKQIGYTSYVAFMKQYRGQNVFTMVQGNKQNMEEMMRLHSEWADEFLQEVEGLSDADFAIMKTNTANVLSSKQKNLQDKATFLTDQLDNKYYEQEVEQKQMEAIKGIWKKDFIAFTQQVFKQAPKIKFTQSKGSDHNEKQNLARIEELDGVFQKMGYYETAETGRSKKEQAIS